jgi:hypothetical protein
MRVAFARMHALRHAASAGIQAEYLPGEYFVRRNILLMEYFANGTFCQLLKVDKIPLVQPDVCFQEPRPARSHR